VCVCECAYLRVHLSAFLSIYYPQAISSSLNMLRFYLLWRVVRDWQLNDLPKRHTLMGFQHFNMGTSFAVKRMLRSVYSLLILLTIWTALLCCLAYWYRAVEISACLLPGIPAAQQDERCFEDGAIEWTIAGRTFIKTNDYYFANAFWLMIVTSTTVGYGDILPSTSLGRTICSLATILGLIVMALLTASLAHDLQWTTQEDTANSILNRERSRLKRRELAAFMIQTWYWLIVDKKRRTKHSLRSESMRRMCHVLRRRNREANAYLEDLEGFGAKVDSVMLRVNMFEEMMTTMGTILWHDRIAKSIATGSFGQKLSRKVAIGKGSALVQGRGRVGP
jgi:hypothetical protein